MTLLYLFIFLHTSNQSSAISLKKKQKENHQLPHRHMHAHTRAHTLLIHSVPLILPPGNHYHFFCIIVNNSTMHYDIIYIQITHPWTDKDRMGSLQSLI